MSEVKVTEITEHGDGSAISYVMGSLLDDGN